MLKDESQEIYVNNVTIIWLSLFRDRSAIINAPCMPLKSENGVFDTSADYLKETVSYGRRDTTTLIDGKRVEFADNILENATRIDERNLICTKFLNLDYSSVTQLNTSSL